ncbi:MAG: Gfo/Idh/MocA family protein [Planctomycetota bacterium]|jgi:predicted dehydrogenase
MLFERLNGKYRARRGITRRRFMRGTGAAALSFTIMKGPLVRGTQANSRLEVGIIGLGGRGKWIGGLIEEHGGYRITSVADYFPEVANAAGEEFKVSKERRFSGLSGYKKLVESKPDAVFLETPPYCFADHVTAAVEAGCHVYIAKPLACDVAGCLTVAQMGRKATAADKVFLVDFQTRTDPFFIEGIKRVHRGDVGKIGMLSSIYTDDAFPDPPKTTTIESRLHRLIWTNDVALGGGMIVNCDIHAIDVALWLAGKKPISATGAARVAKANPNGDTNYLYSVTYEFEDGVILNHRGEHLRNKKGFSSNCDAYCQEGFLETAYSGQVRMLGNRTGYRGGKVENLYPQGAIRNIAAFHKSIINKIYDNPTLEPSINSTLATILGRQAASRNARVTWDQMIKENEKLEVDFTGLKE